MPPGYAIAPEKTGRGRQARTAPDIVVDMPYGLRTIIETEYGDPAIDDAKARLGYKFTDSDIDMKSVIIGAGYPKRIGWDGGASLIQLGTLIDPNRY